MNHSDMLVSSAADRFKMVKRATEAKRWDTVRECTFLLRISSFEWKILANLAKKGIDLRAFGISLKHDLWPISLTHTHG